MTTDTRKKSLIKLTGWHLGTTFEEEADWGKDIIGMDELSTFLDDVNQMVLYAIILEIEGNKRLKFFTCAEKSYEDTTLLVFVKNKPSVLDEKLANALQTFTLNGSPTMVLYQALSQIFTPLMALDNSNNEIQKEVVQLQSNLKTSIVTKAGLELTGIASNPQIVQIVKNLDDEIEYLDILANSSTKKDRLTKTAATTFRDMLKPLAKDFSLLDALPFAEVEDVLEKSHNTLDDLWRHEPPYPSDRTKLLMDIISQEISKLAISQIKELDIWNKEHNEVIDKLDQFNDLSKKWLTSCKQLTEIFWPNYSAHAWKEDPYQPQELINLSHVLSDIINIRNLHKQLLRLLTVEEQNNLNASTLFNPFKNLDLALAIQSGNNSLEKANKKFAYLLEPAELIVANKLKKQLSTINANTRQLLYEFSRYSELIKRPILKQNLQSERQFLLNSLFDYLKQIQSPQLNFVNERLNTSQVIKDIIVNRQMEYQIKEVQRVAEKILDDLSGYDNLNQLVVEIAKDIKQQHQELFESWSSEMVSYIKYQSLSLKESDAVVQFSKQKLMRVNYNPRLVTLITEVRQLRSMNYNIPSVIEETADHAKKFMVHARILEQIANFHNTIGDRMIPSQKPMMLNSALELSKLVQEQEVVSWGDEKSVEKYVDTLKKAVEKLANENDLLTSYHEDVLEHIQELEGVDLIKEYSKWKETLKYIQNKVLEVEDKKFKNMQTWKQDIDKNLIVVLEKQYIKSLDTLHLYLPEIYTDLVYRNSSLHFSPDEDHLKKQYEQQLKKFLEIPKNFHGVTDNYTFAEIIDKNDNALELVEKHKNDLFEQLHGVIKHWQGWLQLETLDVSKLTNWQHWDLHFRASKTFGQEIAKLPSTEERVGCFLIGLSRLRSDLESHNRSYWDQLVYSLKDSIAQDVVKLQNYIDPSTASLTRQPVTMEEVGESGITHGSIIKELPEMENIFDEMLKKSQTLSSWSREQVDSVNRLKGAWGRLKSLLENHQHIIEKQMETVKTTLNIECENLIKEVDRFNAKLEQIKPKPNSGEIYQFSLDELYKQLTEIKSKKEEWTEILSKKEKILSTYEKFNLPSPELVEFSNVESDLNKEDSNWTKFEEFYKELEEISNEYWIVTRKKVYIFEDFLNSWQEKLKSQDQSDINTKMLQEINKFQMVAPFLKFVKGDDFSGKHWMTTFDLLGMEMKPIEQLTLKDFLNVSDKLEVHSKELQAICKKAASEIVVRQALAELEHWEIQSRFTFTNHVNTYGKDILLVKDYKDILNKIGDNQSLLQSVKNSSDYDTFLEKANIWENKLSDLDTCLSSLSQIQRKWIYLEPIFGSGTLAQEKTRFDRIDRDFQHVLNYINKDPRVMNLIRYPNLRSLLENTQEQLNRCQNSLDNFLQEKRNNFPRFLFLSDDDLLEVVGQSSKEQVIQTHLKKLFAGINRIELDENGHIINIHSLQGEVVKLVNPINIKRNVEDWLNALVKEMQSSLKELLVNCLGEKQAPDPLKYPSQILCLADSINFTLKCEQAISSMNLTPLLAKYKSQLAYYSSLEMSEVDDSSTSPEVDNVLDLKLKALLLDTIHHISVLEDLLSSNTTKVTEWIWQKQLRYYANSTGEVTVKMANARMDYSFEYLGNAAKLVRTPLTDNCFLTLTQGIHLGMGGNPYGPAGTGKTESVKALGGLLGRQVLVFNCDEGVDSLAMGRILSGLVRTGAWGCFDEFNRLDEATLSAVSMLIHPIQVALRTNQEKLVLLDQEIKVNRHCGIFVTLNPAGGGYGGRNKLPDNLKQLFRPVVMTHPDHELIARSLLHCDGYQHADLLARKLVEVFSVSNKLMSKQQHYDWGLRAIRTVLSGCGKILKRSKSKNIENSVEYETNLIVKVLRMDTLSKLTLSDNFKFDSILLNIFKGIKIENFENDILGKAIKETYEELKLFYDERQANKCFELYEQLKQRMGVAIIGPPKCGKTTIRKILSQSLNKIKKNIKQIVFNPKSMPRQQLLGQIDLDTKQWIHGVLTTHSLQIVAEGLDVWSWMVCDGDVDPDWIESLNSVLDDNRLLSLPSGWRIQFDANVNFIFETHSLQYASPATISRMGIVLLSDGDIDIRNYINNLNRELPEGNKLIVEPLVDEYFYKALKWIMNEGEVTISSSNLSIAKTAFPQISDSRNKSQFIIGLINSLGLQLQFDFRELFEQQMYDWSGEVPPAILTKGYYNQERDTIDNYYTNPNVVIENITNGIPLVLTSQIQQVLNCLKMWLKKPENHFLIVGPHGSAKTLILKNLVYELADVELVNIYCSANLQPNFVIAKLQQHCISVNTHRGKVYKPKKGNLLLHFKNLHLLRKDKWGTNMLIEFLNQIIIYKGFYDSNIEFYGIENITIVGSLEVCNNISIRFTSNVHICNTSLPEREDLIIIITAYLLAVLKSAFSAHSWAKAKIQKIVAVMISIYDKVQNSFTPIKYKHYNFTPHDLVCWATNIQRYQTMESIDFESYLNEVICYEALRLFGDKMGNEQDYVQLCNIINEGFQSIGKNQIVRSIEKLYFVPNGADSRKSFTNLDRVTSEDWENMVKIGINQYEREGQSLNVLLTKDLLDLTSFISKGLSTACGNIVLVGRVGIGRRSAIKIVSALQNAKLVVPSNTQPQFNNDLKNAMQCAAIDGEQVYLVIEDHILENDSNLNLINLLIYCGEVPGLYTGVELDSLIKGLKDEYDKDNFEGDLVQFFSERIKRNLHVIVCLDVDNTRLWKIMEHCPALTRNCSIIWKVNWMADTIENIPRLLLKNNLNIEGNHEEYFKNFSKIYEMVFHNSPAPFRYIALIRLYKSIYEEKMLAIKSKQNKLQGGVSKLTEASQLVEELKKKAAEQQEKLEEKQSKANAALDMISNTMKNANTHKEEMEVLKQKTETENQQLMLRKKEIEEELSEVEPLIQEARAAVGNIKSESLSEIRSLRAPPDIIRDILEGVLRLMGIQDTSWNSMKTFLAKRGVKEEIRSFDASRITAENRQAVEKLINNKSDSFDPKASKRASVAAAPLAAWVIANIKYSHVTDKIRPLEREQHKLKQNLNTAEAQLGELSAGLLDVDARVAKLKEQLSAYTKEAAEIEINLRKAQDTLGAAEGLVSKLDDEFNRWQEQLKELSDQIKSLPLGCLISAAFACYLSNEFEDARKEYLLKWCDMIGMKEFNFEQFLSSERELMQWQTEGLSSDTLSIQNALIILKADFVPLLIDPTSTAINWLKNHIKSQTIESCTFNSPKFVTTLELAVRFGKALIIDEIDHINPILLPILKREFFYQGERKLLKLNGKLMDFHSDFKLILCSRNEQLELTADMKHLVNVLNFTVTHAGLKEQLLSAAVKQENAELEDKRRNLLREKEELQEKQYSYQNQLLEDLANSTGDILENTQLINSLNQTKSSSLAISKALEQSDILQKKLLEEYNIYSDISGFGSYLYFACNEFSKFNNLYLISVQAYKTLFLRSLETFQAFNGKLDMQRNHLFVTVYEFMARGIFKMDRLNFALHLSHKMYPKLIPNLEWDSFLGSHVASKMDYIDSVPSWISSSSSINIQNLQNLSPEFYKGLRLDEVVLWQNFMNSSDCENKFPAHCQLSEFQKLLVIQALRPDRLYSFMSQVVLKITGLKTIDPTILELSYIFKESNNQEPILLLAMSGTDPSIELRELAMNSNINFIEVAMGEGQEERALRELQKASTTGQWIILKNLHLVTSWLNILNQHIKKLQPHEKFRIWLISEPSPNFNFVLAQNSVKIVYESPQGLKNNLYRSMMTFGRKYFEKLNPQSSRIFFVILILHALVQERRKYIPQGWSKYYEFSDTDLTTCVKLIEDVWQNNSARTPWPFISGLFTEAVYGGRIENIDDMKILYSYVKQFFNDEVLSHRWKPFNFDVPIPTQQQFEEYVNAIKRFPVKDMPIYFGLPENIDNAWEKQTSTKIITTLKNIYHSKNINSNFFDRESFHKGLTPYMTLWKKLNQGYDFIRSSISDSLAKQESAIQMFLLEEYFRGLEIIQNIHKSFTILNKTCKGHILPNEDNLQLGNSLLCFETPKEWLGYWQDGPKDPYKFLKAVINKMINISKWKDQGKDVLNSAINLGCLFYPEALIASVKQDFAKQHSVAMDELMIETSWRNESASLIVQDLLIEGAIFNGSLQPCTANSDTITKVPTCYLNWKPKGGISSDHDKSLSIPLYTNSLREKRIFKINIACEEKDKDRWIKAGVAFYVEDY